MKSVILEGKILAQQEKTQDYLKQMLELPEYYGGNLDALYDCLTELPEMEIEISMDGLEEDRVDMAYFKKLLRVFQDAQEDNEDIQVKIL